MVASGWEEREALTARGQKESFGMTEVFCILSVVVPRCMNRIHRIFMKNTLKGCHLLYIHYTSINLIKTLTKKIAWIVRSHFSKIVSVLLPLYIHRGLQ